MDAFVAHMTVDQPPRPANMQNIVAINQGKKPCTLADPDPPILTPAVASRAIETGHLVLDVRPHALFGAAHAPGAYNVTSESDSFEQNVGWILPPDVPLILMTARDADIRDATHKLAFVGLDDRVEGGLSLDSWRDAGLPVVGLEQIGVEALHRAMADRDLQVLDVRDAEEWEDGTIESAVLTSFKHLPAELARLELAPERPVAVYCAGGMRSSTACSILARQGFETVYNVAGGISAWRAAGLPVVRP